RRTVDYGSGLARHVQLRKSGAQQPAIRPTRHHVLDIFPPSLDSRSDPAATLCCKYAHTSGNKNKHPINCVRWTSDGRRVLTGSTSGEMTLWNGLTFNFETILQAHESAVRAMEWSPSGDWLLSGDHEGFIKYSQTNMNIVKVIPAHTEAIRDIAFSPGSNKFVTASDDGSMKLWSFNEGVEEATFTGHGWDVKTVDWHMSKGLIVSGSKDNLVKLWDPRTAKCLSTLHGHKNTVSKVMFQRVDGDLLATCSRDSSARVVDLRMMRDLRVLRGHEKDVTTLTWHPITPSLITTGAHDGALSHYLLNESAKNETSSITSSAAVAQPTMTIPFAHESAIWSMEYHPFGHLLVTGSNDRATRFWARPRPGDDLTFQDRYHVGEEKALQTAESRRRLRQEEEAAGNEDGGLVDQQNPVLGQMPFASLPGLGGLNALPPGLIASANGMNGSPQRPQSNGIPGFGNYVLPSSLPGIAGQGAGFVPPPPPNFQLLPP
ncbi:WD40-repeat-containing domain protein, partial [Protomyces lactucae-debilis]